MTDPRIEAALQAAWEYTWESEAGCPLGVFRKRKPDVVKNLEGALTAAIAAADAAAWRPIESAPRDGTIINVLLPEDISKSDQDFYCYPGSRVSFGWAWENRKFRPSTGLNLTVFIQPTHWQPLPAPPANEVEA